MLNMLRADFYKLFHLKTFYVLLGLCAFFAFVILADVSNYPNSYQSSYNNFFEIAFIPFTTWQFMPLALPLAIGILVCLFVTNEFSYGTMKDAVTFGYSRLKVFLSKCLVTSVASAIIILGCMVVSVILSVWMFEGLHDSPGFYDVMIFSMRTLLEIGLAVALSVFFTMIAFIIKHTSLVMAVHFSIALFVTMTIGSIFPQGSSAFYIWPANAMAIVGDAASMDIVGTVSAVAVMYISVSFIIGYLVFLKRDMK